MVNKLRRNLGLVGTFATLLRSLSFNLVKIGPVACGAGVCGVRMKTLTTLDRPYEITLFYMPLKTTFK